MKKENGDRLVDEEQDDSKLRGGGWGKGSSKKKKGLMGMANTMVMGRGVVYKETKW